MNYNLIKQYSNTLSSLVGRLGNKEYWIIVVILVFCTGLFFLYDDFIFETYPVCDPLKDCPYLLPVFDGAQTPDVYWIPEWSEFGVVFDAASIKMATLTDVGRSGALRDPMMASGFIAALLVLWLSLPLEQLYRQMVRQMEQDGLVPKHFRALAEVEESRRVWAWTMGIVIFLLMFIGILQFRGGYPELSEERVFVWGSSLLGLVAGHRMGSAFAYGQFARRFHNTTEKPRLLPGHADKAGGWRRFGEFMAYQAVLMFVPLIWLSTWIFLSWRRPEAFVGCTRIKAPNAVDWLRQPCDFDAAVYSLYSGWLTLHVVLLIIMAVITFVGLVRPFYKATIPYREDRRQLLSEHVAQLDEPLSAALAEWQRAQSLAERRAASKLIGDLTEIRESIWSLPRVPLRSAVTGVVSISALYPLIVLALGLLLPRDDELTGIVGRLIEFLGSLGI